MADRTVSDIYEEWATRRGAILRALTTEFRLVDVCAPLTPCALLSVEEFFASCSPHREGLCLFGNLDGTWHVGPPAYEVPPVIPEPCNGINYARDGLDVRTCQHLRRLSWLAFVCVHAESWLLSVAVFRAFCLTQKQREELFGLVNKEAPLLEVVTSSQDINNRLGEASGQESGETQPTAQDEEDEWHDGDGDPCPICRERYKQGNFWICCDFCERWYCGKCVKLNETAAARYTKWKCPSCRGTNTQDKSL